MKKKNPPRLDRNTHKAKEAMKFMTREVGETVTPGSAYDGLRHGQCFYLMRLITLPQTFAED
jgi:hypothetical protein